MNTDLKKLKRYFYLSWLQFQLWSLVDWRTDHYNHTPFDHYLLASSKLMHETFSVDSAKWRSFAQPSRYVKYVANHFSRTATNIYLREELKLTRVAHLSFSHNARFCCITQLLLNWIGAKHSLYDSDTSKNKPTRSSTFLKAAVTEDAFVYAYIFCRWLSRLSRSVTLVPSFAIHA